MRCAVAPQLIGYQPPRFASLAFQQPTKEAFRCTLIATGLDKNINYISVLVNRAPEILSLALDGQVCQRSPQLDNTLWIYGTDCFGIECQMILCS